MFIPRNEPFDDMSLDEMVLDKVSFSPRKHCACADNEIQLIIFSQKYQDQICSNSDVETSNMAEINIARIILWSFTPG